VGAPCHAMRGAHGETPQQFNFSVCLGLRAHKPRKATRDLTLGNQKLAHESFSVYTLPHHVAVPSSLELVASNYFKKE